MKIAPSPAVMAVGPDGKIDIDLIRRNKASAQHAAKTLTGYPWPVLHGQGWRVVDVLIVPKADVTGEEPVTIDLGDPSPAPLEGKPRRGPDVSRKPKHTPPRSGGGGMIRFGRPLP